MQFPVLEEEHTFMSNSLRCSVRRASGQPKAQGSPVGPKFFKALQLTSASHKVQVFLLTTDLVPTLLPHAPGPSQIHSQPNNSSSSRTPLHPQSLKKQNFHRVFVS
ncbi:E3 ubiquitin-protein ligase MIB2 [Platysternon megacephalum]|uniref:E3 ubiquitin-protein ligase MIB2 n=1 Tax=Platysternon megacephalum TaxID=55544 RepID=A0A4D9ES25_9SAUR|nr:E3 ubiquitin-protein ligase MIB2 [Platysternon megacephalum]